MCGITGMFGPSCDVADLQLMIGCQSHRGPDANGVYVSPTRVAGLGHNRLSIIDLSDAGRQPMSDHGSRYWIVFNGEIYNYIELRDALEPEYRFRTRTDTEVLLAAYEKWGAACLNRVIGMFAFAIWDEQTQSLFAARDRFGVKPLNYATLADGTLVIASEIKALHRAGVPAIPDTMAWADYLAHGLQDHTERTFWRGISSVPPGCTLTWTRSEVTIRKWYDLAERITEDLDNRSLADVKDELLSLLIESVRLRFRSDVPVGINLSGGLDSSILLGLVHAVQGADSDVKAFTFITGDSKYDELPWVRQMLQRTSHPSIVCLLESHDVPALAESVQYHEDEPFGGLPTLAYAKVFERAREEGVIVLLDGQGMDEQWAGYDYYAAAGRDLGSIVQGTKDRPVRPECLLPDFMAEAQPFEAPKPFPDQLRNLQYRDTRHTKIPRALRFNDRVSMRSSTELREPFLDHRLFELALRQPQERKVQNGTRKWLLRQIAQQLLPSGVVEAPKRPLQTPQREWLRGQLQSWAHERIELALELYGRTWLDEKHVRSTWHHYCEHGGENSFYIWQWISLGLLAQSVTTASRRPSAYASISQ